MLTKRTHIAPALLAALAFPAAAFAAADSPGEESVAVGHAEVAKIVPLQRPIDRFHRLIHTVTHRIRVEHRAAVRKQRRELFASLPGGVSIGTLESIAACESGGDPTAVSSDGSYRGKYQFDFGTWESVGGPATPRRLPSPSRTTVPPCSTPSPGPAPGRSAAERHPPGEQCPRLAGRNRAPLQRAAS